MNEHQLPVPENDGLITPKVKPWSHHKHHFLMRYIDAFTNSMKQKGWTGLHYIDLFAGAGIEDVEGRGLEWGSPLIAAQSRYPFAHLHLVEFDKEKYQALDKRVNQISVPIPHTIIHGDANNAVHEVSGNIPIGALALAFLDPYGLHLHYETLKILAGSERRRIDLIIFFPDHLDALRNWLAYYKGKKDSNLTMVLGTDSWEQIFTTVPESRWAESLTNLYENQIRLLGFEHFAYERIRRTDNVPLYRLIFCSKHRMGGHIWRNVASKKPDNQSSFRWPD